MVITVWLHMYRVFLTGSYKPPREFNWVRRRDPAGADAAALVHRLPAALGPAGDLGHHGRLEHGAGDAAPRARGARSGAVSPWATSRMIHPAPTRASPCWAARFVGEGALAAVLRAALRRDPARGRRPDGDPLLAGPQGRRHLAPALDPGRPGKQRLWSKHSKKPSTS